MGREGKTCRYQETWRFVRRSPINVYGQICVTVFGSRPLRVRRCFILLGISSTLRVVVVCHGQARPGLLLHLSQKGLDVVLDHLIERGFLGPPPFVECWRIMWGSLTRSGGRSHVGARASSRSSLLGGAACTLSPRRICYHITIGYMMGIDGARAPTTLSTLRHSH